MSGSMNDVDSVSNFKRKTADYVRRLRRTGRPMILTVKGKARLVVQDAAAYQQMVEQAESTTTLQFIQRGRADIRAGRTTPMREAVERLGEK